MLKINELNDCGTIYWEVVKLPTIKNGLTRQCGVFATLELAQQYIAAA